MVPTVKSGYSILGGSVRLHTTAYWSDQECAHDIQFISENKMMRTGFGGESKDRGALVITATTETPEGGSSLLK